MMTLSDLLSDPLWIGVGLALLLIIGVILSVKNRRYPYHACDTLLTQSELRFYTVLKMAVPANTSIMMKVRMADLINCEEKHWRAGWGPRISAKHIDFVLIDPKTTSIKMAIELDDSTHHTNKDRIERDKFVNKAFDVAGVTLLRIPVQKYYDMDELKRSISQAGA